MKQVKQLEQQQILYRPEEAARVIGVKIAKFYELVRNGYIKKTFLPPKYPGAKRTARYHIDDLSAFVDSLRPESESA